MILSYILYVLVDNYLWNGLCDTLQDTTKWKYQKIISSRLSVNSDHVNFITIRD